MQLFPDVAAFVLAGGSSSRMGRDKALLELDGTPVIVRTARLAQLVAMPVTIVAPPERYRQLSLPVVPDDLANAGPLAGIVTALRASQKPWNLILACDLPYLSEEWLRFLVGRATETAAAAVVPQSERGLEPLCAMYHRRLEPALAGMLDSGVRKLTDALQALPPGVVRRITESEWKSFDSHARLFKNMNSPADYAEARRWFGESGA